MSRTRVAIACVVAAVAAYCVALVTIFRGYPHALATACPNDAPAPAGFWPLTVTAVALACAASFIRPRAKNERGARNVADVLAIAALIAVPLAALVTVFGYEVSYACWH